MSQIFSLMEMVSLGDLLRPYPLVFRMWRSMNSRIGSMYKYVQLIFGSTPYQPVQPSDHTVFVAKMLFESLRNQGIPENDNKTQKRRDALAKASLFLKECESLNSLLHVVNEEGYNIVQMAVLRDDVDILNLLITEGCDLNYGKCSLPLHLACYIGNLSMVKFLLFHGTRLDVETGMCYPSPHTPIRHVPSRFHFLETDIFSCDSGMELPLMYAIQRDHVEIVKVLLTEMEKGVQLWPKNRYPLHYACKHGAYKSMSFLVDRKPEELNKYDEEGLNPLLYAVKWGKKFVQFLVESGSNSHAVTLKQQNCLHLLYSNVEEAVELYDTTKFLLGTGLEQDINGVDNNKNTCLHVLIVQVNRMVLGECPVENMEVAFSGPTQDIFDNQVLDTIELLLNHNCDVNSVNSSGVTALHKLMLTFDFIISNDPTGITLETLPVRETYKTDFKVLERAIEILLRHGAEPNTVTTAGRSPLIILLQSILNIDASKLNVYGPAFLRCLALMCQYGAGPSQTLPVHITVVSTLARLGQKSLSQRDPQMKQTMSEFLTELMSLLLQHGLDSNHRTNLRKPDVEGGSGNVLLEMVKVAQYIRQPTDLILLYKWIRILLQWGANPDMEPYPGDPMICHSQSSIFLKAKGTQAVNQYMYEIQDFTQIFEGGYAESLLLLFYNSMDHEALFQCINTAKYMSRFDPNNTKMPSSNFIRMMNNLSSKPRTLKQIARVAIYKSIHRQLNLRVRHLPLPSPLKQYLLNVE